MQRIRAMFPNDPEDPEDFPRRFFASSAITIGVPLLIIFAVQDLLAERYVELIIELIVLVILVFGLYLVRYSARPSAAYRVAIAVFGLFLVYIAFSLDESPERLFWLYMFPVISYFVLGKKEGAYWNIVFASLIYSIVFFDLQTLLDSAYRHTFSGKLRFSVSFFVVSASAFTYVAVRSAFATRLLRERSVLKQQTIRMRRISITDPLTGAYNRGYLHERLGEEVIRATRYSRPLAVVMCDIDHFKKINDTFGHQAGDKILVEFVERIRSAIRKDIDWIARYGGEEFLIVLPETDADGARALAGRIRVVLNEGVFSAGEERLTVTASFGLAYWQEDTRKDTNVYSFINVADERMYQAKREGRNRVVGA